MKTETLTAIRNYPTQTTQETIYKDSEGHVKHIETKLNQLRHGTKTIQIRGKTYLLDWSKALTKKQYFNHD